MWFVTNTKGFSHYQNVLVAYLTKSEISHI